jgi:hypothetical protein
MGHSPDHQLTQQEQQSSGVARWWPNIDAKRLVAGTADATIEA